jgi:hypothetical protein
MSKATKSTKPQPKALTAGSVSLVSISPTAVLVVGGEVAPDGLRPFVGRRLEVHTTDPMRPVGELTLDGVSQNRETGDVHFWAVDGKGVGIHLRAVAKS